MAALAARRLWVIPIVLFALFASVTAAAKAVWLYRLPAPVPALAERVQSALARGDEALASLDRAGGRAAGGAAPRRARNQTHEQRDDRLYAALLEQRIRLERWLGAIAMTASVSPLLGLLGTVSGMIATFKAMSLFGAGRRARGFRGYCGSADHYRARPSRRHPGPARACADVAPSEKPIRAARERCRAPEPAAGADERGVTGGSMLLQFAGNLVVLAIIGLALFCYVVEFNLILGTRDAQWRRQARTWLGVLPILLSALPLLGLLGTITGLLTTFRAMADSDELNQSFVSSGIAEALITTQLGLIMVIPGLLLCSWIHAAYRELVQVMKPSLQERLDQERAPGIDMAPLIDMVFILLIFFIVTTTFVNETGVDVNKPEAVSAQRLENDLILIAITPAGDVWYDRNNIGVAGVRSTVAALLLDEERQVVIQADRRVTTDLLVRVMDEAKLGGAKSLSISTTLE